MPAGTLAAPFHLSPKLLLLRALCTCSPETCSRSGSGQGLRLSVGTIGWTHIQRFWSHCPSRNLCTDTA